MHDQERHDRPPPSAPADRGDAAPLDSAELERLGADIESVLGGASAPPPPADDVGAPAAEVGSAANDGPALQAELERIAHDVHDVLEAVREGAETADAAAAAQGLDELDREITEVLDAPGGGPTDLVALAAEIDAAAAPATRTVAASNAGDKTINEVDAALADDAEELLHGTFETVSSILDDVFQEHDLPVEETVADRAVLRDQVNDPGEVTEPEPIVAPFDEAATESAFEPTAHAPEAPAPTEDPSPPSPAPVETTPMAAPPPGPAPVEECVVSAPPSPAPPAASVTAGTRESEPLPDRHPGKPPVAAHGPDQAAVRAEAGGDDEPAAGETAAPVAAVVGCSAPAGGQDDEQETLFRRVEPLLVAGLAPFNYPLRFVPDRLRPVIDWIALSLVFWVPVVWVLVFLMRGR